MYMPTMIANTTSSVTKVSSQPLRTTRHTAVVRPSNVNTVGTTASARSTRPYVNASALPLVPGTNQPPNASNHVFAKTAVHTELITRRLGWNMDGVVKIDVSNVR